MTSAVDANPNERRIGRLWGIFIFQPWGERSDTFHC